MRIALFGGSFNPPHVAHQLVGLYVLETRPVDELWLVPSFQHPFGKVLVEFPHRLAMCRLMAEALGPRVRVCDIEAVLGGASRTLRTIKALAQAHPEHRFSLVIGADLLGEVSTWHGAEELRARADFLVVGRAGFPGGSAVPMPAVSSTEVRERLAKGLPVEDLLPRAVLDYIRRERLYGSSETPSP